MEIPLQHFFTSRTDPTTRDGLTRGPLAPYLTAYAQRLHDEGYALQSGQLQLRTLGHFNRWLERQRIAATAVDSSTLERYVRARRRAGKLRKGDTAALSRLVRMLPRDDAEDCSAPPTASQVIVRQLQEYLRQERGLAEATITNYTPVVAAFLTACFPSGLVDLQQMTAADIAAFIRRQAERITTKRAATVVTALRSFLRHLLHRGAITVD